jgi:hypothetical protein
MHISAWPAQKRIDRRSVVLRRFTDFEASKTPPLGPAPEVVDIEIVSDF